MKLSLTWLQYLVLGLVFLFPAVVASIKGGGSYILVILIILGLVYGRGWSRLHSEERKILLGFVVLFSVMCLSLVGTEDIASGISRLDRYLRIMAIIPIYLMLRRFDIDTGKAFLAGIVVATFVLAVQGWYQQEVLGKFNVGGGYNRIIFGDLAILMAGIVLSALMVIANSYRKYILYGIACVLAIYASIVSQARGAWLLVPVLIVFLLWIYKYALGKRGWLILGIVFFSFVALLYFWQPETIKNGVSRGAQDIKLFIEDPSRHSSWGERINMWRNSLIILGESPLLGTGVGDFNVEMLRLVEEEKSYSKTVTLYSQAHSIYFHALAVSGLVGFLVLIIALLYLPYQGFYRLWQTNTDPWQCFYALAGMISVVGFAVFGLSEGWLTRNPMVNTYIVCFLVFMSSINTKGNMRDSN